MTRARLAFGIACLAGIVYSAATLDLPSAIAYALAAILTTPSTHHHRNHP